MRKHIKRSGFTLTEILTALVLATMVLTLLMGLTGRISRTNRGIIQRRPDSSWQTQLLENLQADFENCRSITVTPRQIVFVGYSIPRIVDLSVLSEVPAGHLPIEVVYETVEKKDTWWLIRKEKLAGYIDSDFEQSTLMANGIARFRLLDELQTDVAPPVLRLVLEGKAFNAN